MTMQTDCDIIAEALSAMNISEVYYKLDGVPYIKPIHVKIMAKYGFIRYCIRHYYGNASEGYDVTDKGRKLIELGSLNAFLEYEKEIEDRKLKKELIELDFIQSQLDFVFINKISAEKQIELADNQIKTNEKLEILSKKTIRLNTVSIFILAFSVIATGVSAWADWENINKIKEDNTLQLNESNLRLQISKYIKQDSIKNAQIDSLSDLIILLESKPSKK
jgi:hypothetical protein